MTSNWGETRCMSAESTSAIGLPDLLTPRETAAVLRITPRALREHAKDGLLDQIRLNQRVFRYTTQSVRDLLRSQGDDIEDAGIALRLSLSVPGVTVADLAEIASEEPGR